MKDDDGFTLPELIISIVILGVIIGAMSSALIVGLKNEGAQRTRLRESHDAQLVATFLPSDLQSAQTVVLTADTTCSGISNLVRLTWAEQLTTTGATTTYTAAYAIPAGSTNLVRYACTGGGSPAQLVVARNLKSPCLITECAGSISGRLVSLKLTEGTGYTYTVTGARRST